MFKGKIGDLIKFPEGSKVVIVANKHNHNFEIGEEVTIIDVCDPGVTEYGRNYRAQNKAGTCWYVYETDIKKNNKNNLMSRVSNMMKKLLDGDTQKLVKAGFINGDLELTCAGMTALQTIIFDKYRTELVAAADEVIAEEEKEKNK